MPFRFSNDPHIQKGIRNDSICLISGSKDQNRKISIEKHLFSGQGNIYFAGMEESLLFCETFQAKDRHDAQRIQTESAFADDPFRLSGTVKQKIFTKLQLQ